MIKIRPYKAMHLSSVVHNLRRDDQWLAGQEWDQIVEFWETAGPAYSIFDDKKFIYAVGVVLIGNRNGEIWTMFAKDSEKHKVSISKTVRALIRQIIREKNLKRLQALVNPLFEHHVRFVQHVGFRYEGTLRCLGPGGEDMQIYGMVAK